MHETQDQVMEAVIVTLNTEKAFNTLGWDDLWEVLRRMGLGVDFLGCG